MVVSAAHFKDVTNGYEKRTDGLWTHTGKLVVKGGPVDLPAGSIDTAEIAQGAVSQLVAQYNTPVNWAPGTANVWTESTAQATGMFSGVPIRIEWVACMTTPNVGFGMYVGLGFDSVMNWPSVAYWNAAIANQVISLSGVMYFVTPAPGSHRVGIWLYCGMSNAGLTAAAYTSIFVTEQKR